MTRKENALAYMRCQPHDYDPEPGELELMAGSDLVAKIEIPVCERPMFATGYDIFGVHWSKTDGFSHYTIGQKPIYDDIEDWQSQVRFPNVEKFDWESMKRDAEKVDRENKIVAVVMLTGPFERTTELTAFDDCLVNLISDPEDFSDLIGAIADYKIQLIDKIWEAAQPDVYLIHDDWGTARSPFMNPDLWREVIKPHTQRIYDAIHAHGAIVIQHSCGNVTAFVPDMIEMGAEGWDGQPECNDFPALKAQYGDRFFFLEKADIKDFDGSEPPPLVDAYPCYDTIPEFLYD